MPRTHAGWFPQRQADKKPGHTVFFHDLHIRSQSPCQILGNGRGGKSNPDIRSNISNDPLQHIHITDMVSLDNIFHLYGIEQLTQILTAGCVIIAKVAQIGHSSQRQIFGKALPIVCHRVNSMVQLHELPEGKRIDHELHIPSGKISSKLTGKHFGVGTRNVYITIQLHPERVDTFFPISHLLNFIKEQIDLAVDCRCSANDLVMQNSLPSEIQLNFLKK